MKLILVVENGSSISKTIKDKIKENDIEVVIPEGYQEINTLSGRIPNLIIADLTTIKKDKVEFLMNLKTHPVLSLVPYLLITRKQNSLFNAQFSLLNFYLLKPYKKKDLFFKIDNILQSSETISPW